VVKFIPFLSSLIVPCAYILGSVLLGLFLEKQLLKQLRKITQRTSWFLDDILVEALEKVTFLWSLLAGLALTINSLPFPPTLSLLVGKIVVLLFLGSATFIVSEISLKCLRIYTRTNEGIFPLTSLFEFIIKIVIFTLGTLIILQSLNIAITPLLTALGVGGFSLGLALQAPLSNLMSGINIITSGKIQPGDYIQLKTGEEGYVVDIDLRHTILLELTQSYQIIPNTKIIVASLRNYSVKKKEIVLSIKVIVPYETDLDFLEGIIREVTDEMSTSHDFFQSTSIYYQNFDYWNIVLNVYLKVREANQFEHLQVKHDFIKKLNKRYQEEGISMSIPLPWLSKPEHQNDTEQEE